MKQCHLLWTSQSPKRGFFPIDILGWVWYIFVSIPDLCILTYFQYKKNSPYLTEVQWDISYLPFAQNKDYQY